MKNRDIELLAPAGDMQSLKSAVNNGCNAVYLGGKNFNARSSAANFSVPELKEIVEYCKVRNVKVLLTVNVLYKEVELEQLFEFLNEMYIIGIHAFIVQDIGVAMFIKKHFKEVKLHASTQLNAHSLNDVLYLEKIGFDRVILSRELNINEIREIKENSKVELEVFGHGALCVSYSGQCLMSSFIGGRSGNRGKCAGTCRLGFDFLEEDKIIEKGYLLSTKDLCTLDYIKTLKEIGISSIKLEGRMKSYQYVAQITKTYRKALDDLEITQSDISSTTQIFNRGGSLSTGYLGSEKAISMMSTKTPKSTGIYLGKVVNYDNYTNICTIALEKDVIAGDGIEVWTEKTPHVGCFINKTTSKNNNVSVKIEGEIQKGDKVYRSFDKTLIDSLKNADKEIRQEKIHGSVTARLDKPLELKLWTDEVEVKVLGDIVDKALKNPVTEEILIEKLSKTGGTPFKVIFDNNNVEENIFINISAINALRRNAIEKLGQAIIENINRKEANVNYTSQKFTREIVSAEAKKVVVQLPNTKNFNEVLKLRPFRIAIEYSKNLIDEIKSIVTMAQNTDVEVFVVLPKISRNRTMKVLTEFINFLEKEEIKLTGFYISNYGQLNLIDTNKYLVAYDYNFNVFNNLSRDFLSNNACSIALSPELSLEEIETIESDKTELIIHGKLPMMTTEQCPVGLFVGEKKGDNFCKKRYHQNAYALRDRLGETYYVKCNCNFCYAEILASKAIFSLNKIEYIKKTKSNYVKVIITDEDDVVLLVESYLNALNNDTFDNEAIIETYRQRGISNGRLYRGVE